LIRVTIAICSIITMCMLGCGTPAITHYSEYMDVSGAVFTDYSARGFMFSPYMYEGEYESIGMLSFQILPEATWRDYILNAGGGEGAQSQWEIESLSLGESLDSVYQYCVELGADAMVDLKIGMISGPPYTVIDGARVGIRHGLEISGFAIDRQ